jgi:hypothetical protein
VEEETVDWDCVADVEEDDTRSDHAVERCIGTEVEAANNGHDDAGHEVCSKWDIQLAVNMREVP